MAKQEQIEDSVVLSRKEYEMLKSLYDAQKGAIMTSSIGDLPLTVEGLRKAVDEITRLNRVETELQELNAKYYNEAKDLRRELKQTRKENYDLKAENRKLKTECTLLDDELRIARQDTIDVLNKVKEKLNNVPNGWVYTSYIDELIKEYENGKQI